MNLRLDRLGVHLQCILKFFNHSFAIACQISDVLSQSFRLGGVQPHSQGVLIADRRAGAFGAAMHPASLFACKCLRLTRCAFTDFCAAARAGQHRSHVAFMGGCQGRGYRVLDCDVAVQSFTGTG